MKKITFQEVVVYPNYFPDAKMTQVKSRTGNKKTILNPI
jgi:hypothetical protein